MKKYADLFRRVEIFEKLAVYGNRKGYLQSIAQGKPAEIMSPEDLKNHIPENFVPGAKEPKWQMHDPKAPFYLTPDQFLAHMTPKYIEQYKQQFGGPISKPEPETVSVSAPTYRDPTAQNKARELASVPSKPVADAVKSAPTQLAPQKYFFRQEVQDAQQKLKDLGYHIQKIDGLLGPNTRAYLKQYRTYELNEPKISDEETIQILNAKPLPAPPIK